MVYIQLGHIAADSLAHMDVNEQRHFALVKLTNDTLELFFCLHSVSGRLVAARSGHFRQIDDITCRWLPPDGLIHAIVQHDMNQISSFISAVGRQRTHMHHDGGIAIEDDNFLVRPS